VLVGSVLLLVAAGARGQRSAIIAAALFTAVDDDLQEKALGRIRVVNIQLRAVAADFLGVTIFRIPPFNPAGKSIRLR
jgi:hypothetical protein